MPLTISEAIGIFERAFRVRDPNEIERVLRENLNVQVAVIESEESAENRINEGYYPLTVRVPYWVFVSKVKEKELNVYSLEQENIISEESKKWKLEKIHSHSEILPNRTYFILKNEAGYYPDLGLTFKGDGEVTGFEKIKDGEKAEKFGVGREQTWEEHAVGTLDRANRMLETYKPFLTDWVKNVFSIQNLKEEQIKESVDAIILAIKIAVFFHDIGKLRKEWQEAVGWEQNKDYIGRTKGLPLFTLNNLQQTQEELLNTLKEREIKIDENELIKIEKGWKCGRILILKENNRYVVYKIPRLPPHGKYAYPFLRTFLKNLLIEEEDKTGYRFIDHIALAAARHHSLEASGKVEPNEFKLVDNKVVDFLSNLLLNTIPELKGYNPNNLSKLIQLSIKETEKGSLMDEPPSPSDDFYFLYVITNRVIKFADWEDAGNKVIELPEERNDDS